MDVVAKALEGCVRGVYFGFARLPEDGKHGKWCKCVVNVGARPTFADGEGVTVEVHALRDFGRDFYGERMDVVVLGFLRPEMRFDGLQALVARIMADIGLARGALDDRACRNASTRAWGSRCRTSEERAERETPAHRARRRANERKRETRLVKYESITSP